jgi:hypothetical protein
LPLSGWVWEFGRSCGREGEREDPSLVVVVVVAVEVVRGKKEDLGVKSLLKTL